MLKSIRGIAIIALLATAPALHAGVLSWEIVNLSFDDGGTANGRFTLDVASNLITNFDITTTGGTSLTSGFQYTTSTARITLQANNNPGSGWPDNFLQLDSLSSATTGTRELFLNFSGPLLTGGAVAILYGSSTLRPSYELLLIGEMSTQRLVEGPELVDPPVPEPAAMMCLALGLGMMGAYVLRRTRREKATV